MTDTSETGDARRRPSGQRPLTRARGRCRADLVHDLEASTRGDRQAFVRVYDATATSAYLLACCLVRDRTRAQQVVVDAYVNAWRECATYDPASGSVHGWVLTVVQQTARQDEAYG